MSQITMTIKNITGEMTEVPLKPDTTREQAEALAEIFASNPNVDSAYTIISGL